MQCAIVAIILQNVKPIILSITMLNLSSNLSINLLIKQDHKLRMLSKLEHNKVIMLDCMASYYIISAMPVFQESTNAWHCAEKIFQECVNYDTVTSWHVFYIVIHHNSQSQ